MRSMPTTSSVRMRQVVDWRASIWAGLLAGSTFLLLNVLATPLAIGGNGWVMVRLIASIPLGEGILTPLASYDLNALLAAFVTHYVLSIVFSMVLAYMIHRGGMRTGILGGAVFGLCLYCMNVYTLTWVFPWFFVMRGWAFLLTHVLFGTMAGGIYEGLEVEAYIPVEEEGGA
jgi:hypothetical protein